jgi:integrase/recombinase XerD
MNHVSHNRGRRFPPEPLSRDEVLTLMNACSRRALTGKRDRALICLLWRGQLRISEALALKPADFDPAKCTVRVLNGKGGRSRVVVIDEQAAAVLGEWIAVRAQLPVNGRQPIFCTLRGGRINPAQLREKLPRLAKKAGITKRVHCHSFRHSGASELAQEGVALLDIQCQLGHAAPSTTDAYLHALNPVARVARLRSRTW